MAETVRAETSPPTWRRKWPYHKSIIILLFAAVTIVLGIVSFSPSSAPSRAKENAGACAANLNKLWIAMTHYAPAHGQQFPDRIEQLLSVGDLSLGDFVCPNSEIEKPAKPGANAAQTAENLVAGRHLSYVYVARGMSFPAPSNVVVIYEPTGHHPRDEGVTPGAHVLFGDGHIKFIPEADVDSIINQLKAGQNPPPAASGY